MVPFFSRMAFSYLRLSVAAFHEADTQTLLTKLNWNHRDLGKFTGRLVFCPVASFYNFISIPYLPVSIPIAVLITSCEVSGDEE